MRVNSSFTNFFRHRLVIRTGFGTVMLVLFFTASSFTKHPDHDFLAKQVNLSIRLIGHRLLLQSGDFTSRILPVTETKEGTFLLEFEKQFVFNHDSLMELSHDLFPKNQFPSGYTVTVLDCMTANIIYGFQVNNTSPDLMACRGREETRGCYTIEFAFPNFYESIESKTADINPQSQEIMPTKVDPQEVNPKPEEFKTTTLNADINKRTTELAASNITALKADPKSEESKMTIFGYPLIHWIPGGMLVLLGVSLLIGRFGKILAPVVPVTNQKPAITKESDLELATLGKFLFDVKGQRLVPMAIGSEVISLTDKECRILEMLNQSFGELIPRETLMDKIWISEGVITGRSLDMFVSKLRKKLSSDPDLKITNVHGKGYKLDVAP